MGAALSDDAVIAQLGERVRAHRLDRNLTQRAFAAEAGISLSTLKRFESGDSLQLVSLLRILRVLGFMDNVERLVPELAPSPMAELRHQGHRRQRASGTRAEASATTEGGWTWGDES